MRRTVLGSVGIIALLSAGAGAQSASTTSVIAGCVLRVDDGFVLRAAQNTAPAHRRTGGSNSAKASTPVGGGSSAALDSRKETGGANTAKASTPIGNGPVGRIASSGSRTPGAVTPKGSVPVPAGAASRPAMYRLEAGPGELDTFADQLVEITANLSLAPESAAAQTLQVAGVRFLTSGCAP